MSLVRLRICPPKPIKRERKTKNNNKKNIERDSNSSCQIHRLSLTTRPWEHEATGLTEHKLTYIHVLSYGGPIKMAAIPEVFCALVGEDG